MKLQLDEMKSEHLLKEQPILILNHPEFEVEVPRFYYSPPENMFSFQSRYIFKATLINTSDDPAIIVNVVAKIKIHRTKEELIIRSLNEKVNLSSSKYESNNVKFLFVDDLDGALFDILREEKTIKIETSVYYKNTSGACFSVSGKYRFDLWTLDRLTSIALEKGNDEPNPIVPSNIIREWHTSIVQAPIKYKENLKYLSRVVNDENQRKEYEIAFKEVKNDFALTVNSNDSLKCLLFEDNDTFNFKTISKAEF